MSRIKLDVIATSETWLNDNDDINIYSFLDYTIYYCSRNIKKWGGVNNLRHKELNELSNCVENVFKSICVEHYKILRK